MFSNITSTKVINNNGFYRDYLCVSIALLQIHDRFGEGYTTEVDHHCGYSAIQGLLGPSTIITRYELRVGPGIYMFDRPVFELFEKRQTLV